MTPLQRADELAWKHAGPDDVDYSWPLLDAMIAAGWLNEDLLDNV